MSLVRNVGHAVVAELPMRQGPWRGLLILLCVGVALLALPAARHGWAWATAGERASLAASRPPPPVVVPDTFRDPTLHLALTQAGMSWAMVDMMTTEVSWSGAPVDPAMLEDARACAAADVHPRDQVCSGLPGILALRLLARAGEYTPELRQRVARRVVLEELRQLGLGAEVAYLEQTTGEWADVDQAKALLLRREGEQLAAMAPVPPPPEVPGDGWAPWLSGLGLAGVAVFGAARAARLRRRQRVEIEGWGLRIDGERLPAGEVLACSVDGEQLRLVTRGGVRFEGPFDALRSELEEVAEAIRAVIPSAAEREAAEAKAREVAEAHAELSQSLKDRGR